MNATVSPQAQMDCYGIGTYFTSI